MAANKSKRRVNADNDSDQESHHHSEMSEYEKQRLENIKRNQEVLESLELGSTARAIRADSRSSSFSTSKKRSATAPGLTSAPKRKATGSKVVDNTPRRKSSRLAKIETTDTVATENPEEKLVELDENSRVRRIEGDFSLEDVNTGRGVGGGKKGNQGENEKDDKKNFKNLAQDLAAYVPAGASRLDDAEDQEENGGREGEDGGVDVKKEEKDEKGFKIQQPSLRKRVQALKIRGPYPTVKVTTARIYCMAIHENKDKILACGGDKEGQLGFWDFNESQADDYEPADDEDPNVYSYRPHNRTLSSMQYSPTDPNKLFTTSYDGSVRTLDLVHQKVTESYVVQNDESELLGTISFDSKGQHYFFADNDGVVSMKDVRMKKDELAWRQFLHDKKVGCVNVNPRFEHLIVTSSLDRTMKLWDIRKFGGRHHDGIKKEEKEQDGLLSELASYPHRLSVTSAMWSPDGTSIASTSYDDKVRIFNNFNATTWPDRIDSIPEPIEIPHNNQSGRYCTMLRAVWSPQFNWFCIGNMKGKWVDIYSRGTGDLMATLKHNTLTTVPAVNAWHPNRLVLASGTASGKMVVWR